MKLITHSGSFHADEVTACAILTGIARFKNSEIIRTRDPNIIDSDDIHGIIFDVGMVYDPDRLRFDHHMGKSDPTKPFRDDGTPFSSVGLIWQFYGHEFLTERHPGLNNEAINDIWGKIDRSIIKRIDMIDNGVGEGFAPDDLTAMIDDFSPDWDDKSTTEDDAFLRAVEFARSAIERRVDRAASRQRAYSQVVDYLESSPDPRFMVLETSMPWEDTVFKGGYTDLLYVVSEREGSWYCTAVPTEKGSFDKRKPFPNEWSGLRDADLASITGVKDAIFCHPALFICGAKSKEGLMTLLQQALDNEPAPAVKI